LLSIAITVIRSVPVVEKQVAKLEWCGSKKWVRHYSQLIIS